MNTQYLKVERTARYLTIGKKDPETKNIWFVLHGYGQDVEKFIGKFDGIDTKNSLIVAPEGLSRFYIDSNYEVPGASWTTKSCLKYEIEDYIKYLNDVFYTETRYLNLDDVQINVLGFSQGCPTALRWINDGVIRCNRLILWAGFFQNGINSLIDEDKLETMRIQYVYGEKDNFMLENKEISETFLKELRDNKNIEIVSFDGPHVVDKDVFNKIAAN